MLYNFRDSDDQQWQIDTERLTWARASSILSAPSVTAAENNMARFIATEEGSLAPLGMGRFGLVGRRPPDLSIVSIGHVPITDDDGQIVLVCLIQSNVTIKDAQHQEIKRFKIQPLAPPPMPGQPPPQMQVQEPPQENS